MAWWIAPVAMGALGALQGERKRAQEQQFNQAQAELHKYSPWTGMQGQIKPVSGDWFSGALQGGLTGAMVGQQFGGGDGAMKTGKQTMNAGLDQQYRPGFNPWMIG